MAHRPPAPIRFNLAATGCLRGILTWVVAGLLEAGSSGVLGAQTANIPTPSRDIPVLRELRDVRHLDSPAAAAHPPVELKGTVTYVDLTAKNLFLHDGRHGIYAAAHEATVSLAGVSPGSVVQISGVAEAGLFAPYILVRDLSILGTAPMPRLTPASREEIRSGSRDSDWGEFSGTLLSVARWEGLVFGTLLSRGDRISIAVPEAFGGVRLESLVDSEIRVRGALSGFFSQQRQVGIKLFIPGIDWVETLAAPPQDPFSAPLGKAGRLFRFDPDAPAAGPVRLRGVVTARTYLGDRSHFLIAVEGLERPLSVSRQNADAEVATAEGIGDSVFVHWPVAAGLLLDR